MRNEPPSSPRLTMPTNVPAAKLIAAQVTVLLLPTVMYLLARYTPVPLPENADSLVESLLQGAIFGLIGLGAGWLKRPAARDVPVQENGQPAPPPPTT